MLETLFPARYFFPFIKRFLSIRYIVPFVSTLSVHLILSFFRFNASILFMYFFFLSFQAVIVVASFHSRQFLYRPFVDMFDVLQLVSLVCYFLPLVSTIPPLVTSFLSFQLLPSVCCQVVHFHTSVLPFHLSVSICYFFPFALPLSVRLLLELFRCIFFLSFVASFLPFQIFPSVRSILRFNSFLSFVTAFLSFQLNPFIHYFLPFVSTLCFHSFLSSVRFNSDILFVTSLRFSRSCGYVCPSVSPL